MSWPKNKGINRHGKQKRGTAVCSAGKEVSMEKKRNRQKRISKKISKKRNIAAAFILAGMIAVIVMVAVAARTKNGHITGFIQRADYMKGEIEAVSSVDAVYDEETVWQTEEQCHHQYDSNSQCLHRYTSYRPNILQVSYNLASSSRVSASSLYLHAQFPSPTPGVFIRAQESKHNTSCIGTIAMLATEPKHARIIIQQMS